MRYLITAAAALSLAGSATADLYSMNDANDYGYLWQLGLSYDLPKPNYDVDQESCVPTTWTNCFVYAQKQYEAKLGDVEIVGSEYSGWTATALLLRSAQFMNTQPSDGTSGEDHIFGLQDYLNYTGAGPLATSYQGLTAPVPNSREDGDHEVPEWLIASTPNIEQLHRWLEAGAAVVLEIVWAHGDGHSLALVGLEWFDSNENGIVDQGEATLFVVDPLDPSQHYSGNGMQAIGPTKLTHVPVWQDLNATDQGGPFVLRLTYSQYIGLPGQPFDANNVNPDASGFLMGTITLKIIDGPGGSCCLVTGCDVLTETDCGELGGSWALQGSCDDCPEYCEGDTNGDGYVNMDDLLSMLGNWGACQ